MRRVALLALVALVAAGCAASEDDAAPGAAPTVTAAESPSPTPSPTGETSTDPSPSDAPVSQAPPTTVALGDARELGAGFIEGYSRDGRFLLVQVEEHEEGCEGAPTLRLQRVEIETGRRSDVSPRVDGRTVNGTLVRGGDQDRVAIVDSCEGFLVDLWIGTEEADGTIRDAEPLGDALRQDDLAWWTLAWDHAGQSLTVAAGVFAEPTAPRELLRIDPDTAAKDTILTTQHFDQAEQIGADRFLLVRNDWLELLEGGAVTRTYPQSDGSFARSPGGSALALSSDEGLWVLRGDDLVQLTDRAAWALTWSPDERLLTFLSTDDPDSYDDAVHLYVVASDGLGDALQVSPEASAGAGFGAGFVSPGSTQLAYTGITEDAEGYPTGELTVVDLVVS